MFEWRSITVADYILWLMKTRNSLFFVLGLADKFIVFIKQILIYDHKKFSIGKGREKIGRLKGGLAPVFYLAISFFSNINLYKIFMLTDPYPSVDGLKLILVANNLCNPSNHFIMINN